mgnify:CR=1 FL=1
MKDQLGTICSSLCIVHCIATPIIMAIGVSGVLASVIDTEFVHLLLIIPVALLLLLTVPKAYKRYKNLNLVLTALIGMVFLIAALFLSEEYEAILTIIGGSFLIVFHQWSLRLHRVYDENRAVADDVA